MTFNEYSLKKSWENLKIEILNGKFSPESEDVDDILEYLSRCPLEKVNEFLIEIRPIIDKGDWFHYFQRNLFKPDVLEKISLLRLEEANGIIQRYTSEAENRDKLRMTIHENIASIFSNLLSDDENPFIQLSRFRYPSSDFGNLQIEENKSLYKVIYDIWGINYKEPLEKFEILSGNIKLEEFLLDISQVNASALDATKYRGKTS